MSASFSNDNDIIAEVIEEENEESEADQDDEESTRSTPPSTNEVEDALETLQDLSRGRNSLPFTEHGKLVSP